MASALDVAAYILKKNGPMTAMKLQKLVFYSQAWSLVWDEKPLFDEKIRAWRNGPVVRELFAAHKGQFIVTSIPGKPGNLTRQNRETVDAVLKFYGPKPSQWLSDLTHREAPWREARKGLHSDSNSDREITLEKMAEYYGSLK